MNYITNDALIDVEIEKIKELDYNWKKYKVESTIKEYELSILLENNTPNHYYENLDEGDELKRQVDDIIVKIRNGVPMPPISISNFVIIYGNEYLLACEQLGVKTVPVIEVKEVLD